MDKGSNWVVLQSLLILETCNRTTLRTGDRKREIKYINGAMTCILANVFYMRTQKDTHLGDGGKMTLEICRGSRQASTRASLDA